MRVRWKTLSIYISYFILFASSPYCSQVPGNPVEDFPSSATAPFNPVDHGINVTSDSVEITLEDAVRVIKRFPGSELGVTNITKILSSFKLFGEVYLGEPIINGLESFIYMYGDMIGEASQASVSGTVLGKNLIDFNESYYENFKKMCTEADDESPLSIGNDQYLLLAASFSRFKNMNKTTLSVARHRHLLGLFGSPYERIYRVNGEEVEKEWNQFSNIFRDKKAIKISPEDRDKLFREDHNETLEMANSMLFVMYSPRTYGTIFFNSEKFVNAFKANPFRAEIFSQFIKICLPPYLLIPYAPSPYVDWEQVQTLQFRLALMAPHHPVALWKFRQLIGSWSSLLIRHLEAFTAVEESREDVTDELGALYEYKERVEEFHHSLSELERSLNERISTEVQRGDLADPMFLVLQRKKDESVKRLLQAQGTGEGFWVLGKLAKKRSEAVEFYKEAARKNYPLGFIGLGNREADIAGKILLYLEADKLGEHYAWVELAGCVIKKPQNSVIKYLTERADPTTSSELEARVNLESLAFEVLREKLGISTTKEVIDRLTPLHLSSYRKEENRDSQIPQEVYRILEQLIPSHQLASHFYLRAGSLGVPSAYHELARLIERYSPTSISFDKEGNEEEQQRLSEAGFNLFKESMYEVMSQRGDPWGAYELVGTRGGPKLCRKAGNFKSYLELAFSHGDKDMYQDALERFRAHFDSVRNVFSKSRG